MLKVCHGPFHPDLEDAFTARLGELSARREPVLVVAPSRRLAERLQRLAAVEQGLSLLDVHFHTFHSLALAVTEGAWGSGRLVADPVFHDRVVDALLVRRPGLGRLFGGEDRPRGLAGALRASLRDLSDAGVSAEDIAEHFGEGLLPRPEDRARLSGLLRLGGEYGERLERLGIFSPSDLVRLAEARAGDCSFLARFREVLYYGFYDLTGLQLDFFEAVCARCPTRLYFPYRRGHPAFRFADPFFEQKLLAHDAGPVPRPARGRPALEPALDGLFKPDAAPAVSEVPQAPAPRSPALSVVSVSGARDEAWAAAKEILRLVEREGFAFEEIGVAARSLEPYRSVLVELFRENAIPFDLAGGEPLLRHPLAKTALNLLTLRQRDFPAATVEDVFSSPYFRGPVPAADWRRLIRRLGVHSGWLQWRGKLERRAAGGEERGLWELVAGLERELSDESAPTWSGRAGRARALLEDHLRPPAGAGREAAVWDEVLAAVSSLSAFDLLGEPCDWRSFLESLEAKLRRAALDWGAGGRGVRVRDVMDARGESFRALILLGLKEKSFPRTVDEDPLLRDPVRAALRHPAGYWIAQKSSGHEEERLLFYLMAASARERLVCVFPRSDEAGRVEVPSLYLRELCRAAGLDFSDPAAVLHVPRQPAAKLLGLDPEAASGQELSLRIALEGRTAAGRLPGLLRDAGLLDAVLERAAAIGAWGRPGPFDGLTGPPREYLDRLKGQGLSPSALDSLASCPFQFFAARVLGLGESQAAAPAGEFPALLRGTLYHKVLERFYAGAEESLWRPGADWEGRLEDCVAAVFGENGWQALGVYPLLWQAARRAMAEELRGFLAWDLEEARRSGLRPGRLEAQLDGELPAPAALKVHGVADRIDRAADGRWRVVDYKTRWTRGANLRGLALKGALHQLPVYAELARGLPGHEVFQDACIYAIEDSPETTGRERSYRYGACELEADQGAFLKLVAAAVEGLRAGRFLIAPEDGEHGRCSRCPFPLVCRKSHGPSRVRAASVV